MIDMKRIFSLEKIWNLANRICLVGHFLQIFVLFSGTYEQRGQAYNL